MEIYGNHRGNKILRSQVGSVKTKHLQLRCAPLDEAV